MLKFKLKNMFLTFVYSLLFIAGYFFFLNYYFEYMGFTLVDNVSVFSLITPMVISLFPIFFYRGTQHISSFISIFIFLLLYIPVIFTFTLGLDQSRIGMPIIFIQLTFMVGMIILLLADRVEVKKSLSFGVKYDPFPVILSITIFSILYVLFIYRSNLNFSDFEDVYEHRFANSYLGNDLFTGYLSAWLSNFMIPICLAYGLLSKKKTYYIVGVLGCLSIYMSTSEKGVLFFPVIFFGFHLFLSKKYEEYSFLALILIFAMAISLCFDFNMASSIFWVRTIATGGHLTMHYYNFFSDHPYTYYTHINIVNKITGLYPYKDEGIGNVIGGYFWSGEVNANANFWAIDGIAAAGLFGVIISSIFMFLILILFNIVTNGYNRVFIFLCFIPYIQHLLNSSLFSSLWTGGGILMIIFFTIVDKRNIKFEFLKSSELL